MRKQSSLASFDCCKRKQVTKASLRSLGREESAIKCGGATGTPLVRSRHNLADLSTAVLASHVDDGTGRCRGCRRLSDRVVAWPCVFVRLAMLAENIAKGDLGEQ